MAEQWGVSFSLIFF